MRSVTWPFSNRISMRDSAGPRKRTRTRAAVSSSISAVCPAAGFTESSDSADPSQLTVIEPPDEAYVLVNGAGPCDVIVLEVELDELLDDELDDELDDTCCPPIDGGGWASTVAAGIVDTNVSGMVVIGVA